MQNDKRLIQLNSLKNIDLLDIKQFENTDRDRPDFSNRFLKIIYFFRYEGVASTLRKYFAHKTPQHRYLTFLIINFESQRYINISTQFQTDPSKFVILNLFFKYVDIDFTKVSNRVGYYLGKFNQFAGTNDLKLFNIDDHDFIRLDARSQELPIVKYEKGLFVYGLGGYVRMFIMHHFSRFPMIACIDYKANITENFKTRYGFNYAFIIPDDSFPILNAVKQPAAIIASYHADHASLAHKIFNYNPRAFIFIEKPPTVTLDDLSKLIELYNQGAKIEIGFNRRFIDYSKYVKKQVQNRILIVTCSIKEVNISPNHWYLWKNQGTRITGNCVHWFDLANFWIGSMPVEVNLLSSQNDAESCAISVLYSNGSILNITATDKGNSLRGVQEKIEIRFDNDTIFIDDFNSLTHIKSNGVKARKRRIFRDKGHNSMYKNFRKIIDNEKSSDYSVVDLIHTAVVTYYAAMMLEKNIRNLHIGHEVEKYLRSVKQNTN